nr:hypothetical protein [Tanacetum cinerariifolium]
MQAYLDKEEKLKKADKEERLLAISKPEVIKVVQEEAEKIRLDSKKIASAKAVVQDLMNSLSQIYERIRKIPEELGIKSSLPAPAPAPAPAPEQTSSKSSREKRKHLEL